LGDRIAFPLSSSTGDSGAGLWPCYSLLRNGSIGRTRPAVGCGWNHALFTIMAGYHV
jgi:hypothetical protein